jgi:hypothetical protein
MSGERFDESKERQRCPNAPKVVDPAARDAQSVMASLASSATTLGGQRFVPASASIASRLAAKVTAIG